MNDEGLVQMIFQIAKCASFYPKSQRPTYLQKSGQFIIHP